MSAFGDCIEAGALWGRTLMDAPCEGVACDRQVVDEWSLKCAVHPGERLCGDCCQARAAGKKARATQPPEGGDRT